MDLKFYYVDGTMLSGGEESAIRELVNGRHIVVHGYRTMSYSNSEKPQFRYCPRPGVSGPKAQAELIGLCHLLAHRNNIPVENLQLEFWFHESAPKELVSELAEELHYVGIVQR